MTRMPLLRCVQGNPVRKRTWCIPILFLVVLSVSALFYFAVLRQGFGTVLEGRIYRSSQPDINDLEAWIRDKGLKSIINLRGKKDDEGWFILEKKLADTHGIALYNFRLSPHELPGYLDLTALVKNLAEAERPLLIHCRHGVDRTGLVSALALAIEKDPPLQVLKEQFSWKYGVLPFYTSTGPYFFSVYERWLKKTGSAHSLETLLYWIRNVYVDSQGNMEYSIGTVNGKPFEGNDLRIGTAQGTLSIEGWAFDSRDLLPPEGMIVSIGDQLNTKARFYKERPDVAEYFGLASDEEAPFLAGWQAEFTEGDIPRSGSCHTISLTILREKQAPLMIKTDKVFCVE